MIRNSASLMLRPSVLTVAWILSSIVLAMPSYAYVNPEATSLIAGSKSVRLGETTTLRVQPDAELNPQWSYEWHAVKGSIVENPDHHTAVYTAAAELYPGWDIITVQIYDDTSPTQTLLVTRYAVVLVFKQFAILKSGTWGYLSDNWKYYMNYMVDEKHIKTSVGVVTQWLDPSVNHAYNYAEFIQNTKTRHDSGYVEFWNNGYDFSYGPDWWEFSARAYDFQKMHLDAGEALAHSILGFPFTAFAAPYNHFDATTATVVGESLDLKVWLFGPTSGSPKMVLGRSGGEIESATGMPSFTTFTASYNPALRYVVLQHSPNFQTFRDNFGEFQQIIDYLIAQRVTFIQPTEYCRLVQEGVFPLDPHADSDGDGIPDVVEGQGDSDHDGLPDFLDTQSGSGGTAPVIFTQPLSQTCDPLSMLTFTVGATGSSPLVYQWSRNGARIQGATQATYVIARVQETDEGSYICTVSNPVGSMSSAPATLSVNHPPTITTHPESQSVIQAAEVTFTVAATGTAPLSYQWLKNGTVIASATAPTYRISSVIDADQGEYRCYVSNAVGTLIGLNKLSNPATLVVWRLPEISRQPISQTVDFGSTVEFSIEGTGMMPLTYQWRRGGTALSGATGTTLALGPVVNADEGDYDCVVSDRAGDRASDAARLTVHDSVITSQPAGVQGLAGWTVHLDVLAQGSGVLSYRWYHRSSPLSDTGGFSGTSTPSLQIANITHGYQGHYHCQVTGADGPIDSNEAFLEVTDPAVVAEPLSYTLNPGQRATFSVSVSGTTPFGFQWMKDDIDIEGGTDAQYSIESVAEEDEGGYRCRISNPVQPAGILSNVGTLSVNDPPTITLQPASRSVDPTDPVTFRVEAIGMPPLSYQWRKNGAAISGASASVYSITAVSSGDGGAYACYVSNDTGNASGQNKLSSPAYLTVSAPPSITEQPGGSPPVNVTRDPGQSVTFRVTATGGMPLSYQWRKNGNDMLGKTQTTLTILSVSPADEAIYTCYVSNSAGTKTHANVESDVVTLLVNDAPVLTTQPVPQFVVAGSPATFSVTVDGSPPIRYQWKKGVMDIANATTESYTIPSTTESDVGMYSCYVANTVGSVLSESAALTFYDPVRIVVQPVSQTDDYGTTVQFSVAAAGTLPRSYQWKKNGVNLTDGGRISGAGSSTLHILSAENGDEGAYTCRVNNQLTAQLSDEAALVVRDPVITSQPQDRNVLLGHQAAFSVSVAGSGPAYQWYKGAVPLNNNSNISGATSATLTLLSCAGPDEGAYHCLVSGPDPAIASHNAQLTVGDPAVLTEPLSQTVDPDDSVTFSLALDPASTPPISYQWRKDDVDIARASGTVGAGGLNVPITYVIAKAAQINEGAYACHLSGFDEITSAAATLVVNDPPVLGGAIVVPETAHIYPMSSASMTVPVTSGTQPLSYQWQRNGVDLVGSTRIVGVQTPALVINSAIQEDEGEYACLVSNSAGTVLSNWIFLMVGDFLDFVHQPENQKRHEGDEARFTVQVIGGREPIDYVWKFENTGKTVVSIGANSRALIIPHVAVSDAGSYWCEVTDPRGTYVSDAATLQVAAPLEIVQQPHGGYGVLNNTFTFTVLASGGFPPLAYEWRKDDRSIPSATSSTLEIASLENADAGTYTCVVSDSDSGVQQSDNAVLRVGPAMPAVSFGGFLLLFSMLILTGAIFVRRIFL